MPAHEHDCDRCRFLGTTGPTPVAPHVNAIDHYYCAACEGDMGGTLIQRYGSDGAAYASFPLQIVLSSERIKVRYAATLQLMKKEQP